jgi:Meiotically up-regulated gene 113
MEHLYIIATNEDGPCKIGKSRPNVNRLASLQTGNPEQIREYGTYKLRSGSSLAERLAHGVMEDHKRTAVLGQREWFDVTVRQAKYVLRDLTRKVAAVDKDDVVVSNAFIECALDGVGEYQAYSDWHDENNDGDCPKFEIPDVYLIKALSEEPTHKHDLSFREFLATFREGYPFNEWNQNEYTDESRPTPNFKNLKSLLPTIKHLTKLKADDRLDYPLAWLRWCYGRDIGWHECEKLVSLWNDFGTHFNVINGNQQLIPEYGIDDTVNGVRFYGIAANEHLGHGAYLYFKHRDFRAILKLSKGQTPLDPGHGYVSPNCQKVDGSKARGFIWPNTDKLFDEPFDRQVKNITIRMSEAFVKFIGRENFDFPKVRETVPHYRPKREAQIDISVF